MVNKRSASYLMVALSLVCLLHLASLPAAAQGNRQPIVTHAQQAVSPELRTLKPDPPSPGLVIRDIEHIPLHQVPSSFPFADQALQKTPLPLVSTTDGLNFDGLAQNGYVPPDSNGAVGATQYVTWINVQFAVYDKTTGAKLAGPFNGNTLFSALGGACAAYNSGDPVASYDRINGRWVLTQPVFSAPYYDCIAVSKTSDATGAWNLYAFPLGSTYFPDYPKTGVWPDAYYRTYNLFTSGYLGPEACAYDGAAMRAGSAATSVCFSKAGEGDNYGSLLPADFDGTTLPPSGEPEFFVQLGSNTTDNRLFEFRFHVDFNVPSNSTFTGPFTISVPTYTVTCGGGGGACVPQKGTSQLIDALGDRIMFRLPYRNMGDHEVLLGTHTVTSGSVYGVRWYEIRDPNGSPTAYQSGTFQPDSNYRFVPSIAMDQSGDIAVGYSISSSSIYPEIAYTGRVPSDPLGTLESEDVVKTSLGSSATNRWGDYTAMTVDVADDCTFWYINQYQATTGITYNWVNRINNFKFTGCGGPPTPNFNVTATPSSQTVVAGGSTSYTATVTPTNGFTGSVTMSVSGLPSGASGSFSPNPVVITSGAVNSTLTVTTVNTTPAGTYTLTIAGTSGTLNNSTTVTLVVNPAGQLTFTPTSVGFGNQVINTTSAIRKVTVTSSGGAAVNFTSIATDNSDYAETNNCPSSLAAGAKCTVSVTFTPSKLGADSGNIVFTDDASGSPQTVPLTGNGVAPATLMPASGNFGNVAEGTPSAPRNFTLTNNQSVALNISSITTSNPDYAQTNTCGGSVAAHGHCTISVTFTPSILGTETGTLTVSDSASNSPQTASMTGTGVVPATLMPTSANFGNVPQGTPSSAKNFTLTNNAVAALSISSITTSNPDYTQTNTCGSSLAGKSHCTISVTFTPSNIGTETGTLTVTDGALNSPQTASLTGVGIAQATVAPTSMTFAAQKVGTTSAPHNATLKNNLTTSLTISSLTFSGANAGDYAQTNNCGSSLAAKSACTISVTFTPTATGSRTATLNVNDSANNSPQTVSLTGTGK